MKLHLPNVLLSAVLTALAAIPAQGTEIPDNYTKVNCSSAGDFNNYAEQSTLKNWAILLENDLLISPDTVNWNQSNPLVNEGNFIFTSASQNTPSSIKVTDGTTSPFYFLNTLVFDTLSNLTFDSNPTASAISVESGVLRINRVNDNIDSTVDVLFDGNARKYFGAIFANESKVEITHNGDILFTHNSATAGKDFHSVGGAITTFGEDSSVCIQDNADVTFSENSTLTSTINRISAGGAIFSEGTTTISGNDNILFSSNRATTSHGEETRGGAIYSEKDLTIRENADVTFTKNSIRADELYAASGGAIYTNGTLTISDNANVCFDQNSAISDPNAIGGAIATDGDIIISNNSSVRFSQNVVKTNINNNDLTSHTSYGGAIYASSHEQFLISKNDEVIFSGNSAYSSTSSTQLSVNVSSHGGAISYGLCGFNICDNKAVIFNQNSAVSSRHASGGAIYDVEKNALNISNNEDVTFTGNFAQGDGGTAIGGAIHIGAKLTIGGNNDVNFNSNYTVATSSTTVGASSIGGAISGAQIDIDGNNDVTFRNNRAEADSTYTDRTYYNLGAYAAGGAIQVEDQYITVSNNNNVDLSSNSASATASSISAVSIATGGAIATNSKLTFNNNADVSFRFNTAVNEAPSAANSYNVSSASGGAIYCESFNDDFCYEITLNNNSSVTFEGNSTISTSKARGGAIFTYGDIYIQGNDNVTFRRNFEKEGNNYRLRSIYQGGSLNLSAKTGGLITILDSLYTYKDATLNASYTDANGTVQQACGDIIISGKDAEQHLNEILASNNENRAATAAEIRNSQTSIIESGMSLHGGSLQVVDGAVLKVNQGAVSVAAESKASLTISNAEFVAENSKVEVGKSATLQLSNGATITAKEIEIAAGATLSVVGLTATEVHPLSVEMLTMSDSEAAVSQVFGAQRNVINADLTFATGSTIVTDGTGINMSEGSILTFNATSGEKINLVFTLGTEYSEDGKIQLFSNVDIVKFLMDGKEVDTATTLLASDFFAGDAINENTTLYYDSTTNAVYLQGVSNAVPEPTTATLSLLALAALAARRKRK